MFRSSSKADNDCQESSRINPDARCRGGFLLARMEEIKSVIFDWGGVLIDDPAPALMRYCADALAVPKEDYIEAHRKFATDFQTDRITEDTFLARLCGQLGVPKPKTHSLWGQAFKAAYRPKADMFSLARSLRENGCKIALLSNTEIPAMRYFYQQKYDVFDVLVFSCAEGIAKPERKIYELALEKLGVEPEQSVFIDDKGDCIEGAKEAGLNTILFKSVDQVKKELSRLSVKIS